MSARILLVTFLLAWTGKSALAESFRQVLTGPNQRDRSSVRTIQSKDATPQCPIAWSIRQVTLHGGKQEGVEVVIVNNGKLQLTVVPVRGMGLLSVTMGDVRLGWDSPVKEVVHPKFIN